MKYTGKKEEIKYFTDSEEFYDEPETSKSKKTASASNTVDYSKEVGRINKKHSSEPTVKSRKNSADDNSHVRTRSNSANVSRVSTQENSRVRKYSDSENTQRRSSSSLTTGKSTKKKKKKSLIARFFPKNDPLRMVSFAALVAELILTILFIIVLINLDVLTAKIVLAIILALALFFIFFVFAWRSKAKVLRIVGLAVSLLLCVTLAVGSYYISLGDATLEAISVEEGYVTKIYNIAVKADDKASKLSDTADYQYGVMSLFDGDEFDEAMKELRHRTDNDQLSTTDYSSPSEMYAALLDGKCQAMMYQQSFTDSFTEVDETFETNIKVIDTITIMVKESVSRTATVNTLDVTTMPFSVYISGNDEWGSDISTTGRSDVNMIVTVNFTTHQVLLTSIPRDYYVSFPGVSGSERDKLTHAGLYGMQTQIDTLNNLYGIDISYYVKVNFSSLINIVDAIGGLDINNPYAFEYTYEEDGEWYSQFEFPEGLIHLNGEQTLFYARERYSIGGDNARAEHQQIVIEAIIDQLVSASSVIHYAAIMDAIETCAVTNMPSEQIKSFVKAQLDQGGSWQVLKSQAYGEGYFQPSFSYGGELSVLVPYAESITYISDLMQRMMNGEVIPDNYADSEPGYNTLAYEIIDCDAYYGNYSYEEEEVVEEPVVEEPVVEEPVVEEPIVEEPIVEEPVQEDEGSADPGGGEEAGEGSGEDV